MKLLLDENLPRKLKRDLMEHDVYHVADMKWQGKKNGQLLTAMLEEDFDVLITIDQNLSYQQNFNKYPITVLVLLAKSNSYPQLKPLASLILEKLEELNLPKGAIEIGFNKHN